MKRFKIEFEVVEHSMYSASVEAETPEEALKLWKENQSGYDSNQDDMLSNDNLPETAEVTGEWIEDPKDDRFATLERFDTPIK